MGPDSQGEDILIVSINSLYLNRKCPLLIAHLEMQVGETALEIPYKINTGSEGNLMPLYIFKKTIQKHEQRTTEKVRKRKHKAKNI